MKELLRSHSLSYVEGLRIALEGHGIHAVLLDEQAPGYLGFAGRVRLAVANDADYERAMKVVRALETPEAPFQAPPSWAWQRWGLLGGAMGLALLVIQGWIADTADRAVVVGLFLGGVTLLVAGVILIGVGLLRDRK